jgi:hypothetical protein
MSAAPMFSFTRASFVVPGIGTIQAMVISSSLQVQASPADLHLLSRGVVNKTLTNDAYLLNVLAHGTWNDQRLVEIATSN